MKNRLRFFGAGFDLVLLSLLQELMLGQALLTLLSWRGEFEVVVQKGLIFVT